MSTLTAYRIAIDDLLDWSSNHGRNVFEEATIVDYLTGYERRAQPAPATYYRRFGLLRRFLHWVSRRNGLPDPFLELEPPPKPQQEADWLTEDEFAHLLVAAEHPRRRRQGLPSATGSSCSRSCRRACGGPSWSRSTGATWSSRASDRRCSSAGARAPNPAASRSPCSSPTSCGSYATSGSRRRRPRLLRTRGQEATADDPRRDH